MIMKIDLPFCRLALPGKFPGRFEAGGDPAICETLGDAAPLGEAWFDGVGTFKVKFVAFPDALAVLDGV